MSDYTRENTFKKVSIAWLENNYQAKDELKTEIARLQHELKQAQKRYGQLLGEARNMSRKIREMRSA